MTNEDMVWSILDNCYVTRQYWDEIERARKRPYNPQCCPVPQLCIVLMCECGCHERKRT